MIFTSPTGTKFKLRERRDIIYQVLQQYGYFEDDMINESTAYLKMHSGDVIDIGANIGTYCIELATRFPDRNFYAFEPIAVTYDELQDNIALNRYTNIKTHCLAIGNNKGVIEAEFPNPNYELGHITLKNEINKLRLGYYPEYPTAIYNITTLDSFQFDNISLLKIDVEGMEYEVLEGAVDTITRCRPMIIFEAWTTDWFVDQRKNLIDFVKDLNYKLNLDYGDNIIATPL